MANIKEKFDSLVGARKRMDEIAGDETVTLTKLEVRLVQGGYKLIATTYPVKEDE